MADTKTGTPQRRRTAPGATRTAVQKATRTATKKPALAAVPTDDSAAEEPTEAPKGTAVVLDHIGDSVNYSKWTAGEPTGCKGTLYAPLGAKQVTVYIQ